MDTGIKRIEFPAMDPTEQAKLKRFLETTAEFMGSDFETELMTVMVCKVDVDRKDVINVLTRVQTAQIKMRKQEGVSKK
jgi:hypothetical protein